MMVLCLTPCSGRCLFFACQKTPQLWHLCSDQMIESPGTVVPTKVDSTHSNQLRFATSTDQSETLSFRSMFNVGCRCIHAEHECFGTTNNLHGLLFPRNLSFILTIIYKYNSQVTFYFTDAPGMP